MTEGTWRDRVDAFWRTADDEDAPGTLAGMRALVEERPDDDPEAVFAWASVHDFLGAEEEAVGHYLRALGLGLAGRQRVRAQVQMASSLRNLGAAEEALAVLGAADHDAVMRPAVAAFRALVLHDLGRYDEALALALTALAPTLPDYGRAVSAYAQDLLDHPQEPHD